MTDKRKIKILQTDSNAGCAGRKGDDFMAGSNTNISIRMDSDLKAQAEVLFAELGMNLSTAFNIFVRQSLREGRIPFDISLNPQQGSDREKSGGDI